MLTMDDMLAITKPHNDKIVAEYRADEAERKLAQWQWRPICDRPQFDLQPIRQFVRIEGSRLHHGDTWARAWCGEAYIRPLDAEDGINGYRAADMLRLCADGDMDIESAVITHWMPAVFPAIPK